MIDQENNDSNYEFNDISELYGESFAEWRNDVSEYRYLGYSADEIADELGISPKVVGQFERVSDREEIRRTRLPRQN